MYTYLQNQIVPEEKAFLHIRDLSVQRGYGIFDFFKVKCVQAIHSSSLPDGTYGGSPMSFIS